MNIREGQKESGKILLTKPGSISSCLKSQAFLSLFSKNSNWVKYRKFIISPFYLLLHLCKDFISDDNGDWLSFGALVSYLMWGSSWESIHTCHSWALLWGRGSRGCYWTSPCLSSEKLFLKLVIGPLEKMPSQICFFRKSCKRCILIFVAYFF